LDRNIRPEILANVGSNFANDEWKLYLTTTYAACRYLRLVQDRDMGAAGSDITKIVNAFRKFLPRGSFITIRDS